MSTASVDNEAHLIDKRSLKKTGRGSMKRINEMFE